MCILQHQHVPLCTQEVWDSNFSYAVRVSNSKLKNISENCEERFFFLYDGQWPIIYDHVPSLVYLNAASIPCSSISGTMSIGESNRKKQNL